MKGAVGWRFGGVDNGLGVAEGTGSVRIRVEEGMNGVGGWRFQDTVRLGVAVTPGDIEA